MFSSPLPSDGAMGQITYVLSARYMHRKEVEQYEKANP